MVYGYLNFPFNEKPRSYQVFPNNTIAGMDLFTWKYVLEDK